MSDAEANRLSAAAVAAHTRGDGAGALSLARQALALAPLDPNANQIVGMAALDAGDLAAAKQHFLRARTGAPNQPHVHNLLGVALKRSGERDAARAALTRGGELGLGEAWRNLGNLETDAGDAAAAVAAYDKAVALQPRDAAAHASLAFVLEQRHDLAGAARHARAALKLDPTNTIARLALAQVLLREKDFAAAETEALAATAEQNSKTNRSLAWGLVGEARDRQSRPQEAFAAFAEANHLLLDLYGGLRTARHLPHHPAGVARMLDLAGRTQTVLTASSSGKAPVFLVGFPRSGTTLLDQILSSHSGVASMEEKDVFAETVSDLLQNEAKLAVMSTINAEDAAARREAYWRAVEIAAPAREERLFVDKLPLNLIFLPLIHLVFPDAKVIFALRDPRDCVLSCFQQRFGMNAAMVQFLELPNAAAYYDLAMRVFERSRERLGENLHIVRYEDVVADIEDEARRLASFLEIGFEPAMLDFSATARSRGINTPSVRQVAEPLYRRAIGKWRAYAAELAPVLPMLNEWALRWGYPP